MMAIKVFLLSGEGILIAIPIPILTPATKSHPGSYHQYLPGKDY